MHQIGDQVIVQLAWVAFYALAVIAAALTVLGSIAFWRSNDSAGTFTHLFERAEVVKLSAVVLIVLSVTTLALVSKIEPQSVVAVLSGIAGYVLGGLQRSSPTAPKKEERGEAESRKSVAEAGA